MMMRVGDLTWLHTAAAMEDDWRGFLFIENGNAASE